MKFIHVFTEKASNDLLEAVMWEESRHEGLGEKLIKSVDETVQEISKAPLGYISRYLHTREKKVKTFSYQLIYTVENGVIYIHALCPCKQHPDKKYKNL